MSNVIVNGDGRRPLIGVSASVHDFGDYGAVGVQRPLHAAGGLPGWRWRQMETLALGLTAEIPEHPRHPIAVTSGSLLGLSLGATEAEVNSFHHQAVDRLGEGLRATATAPDGVIEAVELDGAPVLGVQWELQEEWCVDARFTRVFEWLVDAAAERASAAPA